MQSSADSRIVVCCVGGWRVGGGGGMGLDELLEGGGGCQVNRWTHVYWCVRYRPHAGAGYEETQLWYT